jgi:hypothetical protein
MLGRGRAEGGPRWPIIVRVMVEAVSWLLGDAQDARSSTGLCHLATWFQVQGLELDWTRVTGDADLRPADQGWTFHRPFPAMVVGDTG